MAEFLRVARVDEIPDGGMKAFEVEHVPIVICCANGRYFAIADECSHDSAPISSGHIEDCEVVCPRHGARFGLEDGSVKAPPAVAPIETYELRIENGDIYVMID